MIDTLNFHLDLKEMDKTTFSKLMQRISITKQKIFMTDTEWNMFIFMEISGT